jgi:hypothetical protein
LRDGSSPGLSFGGGLAGPGEIILAPVTIPESVHGSPLRDDESTSN